MSLAAEYQRQLAWRDWATVLDALPLEPGQLVLDLGCGVGDLAAALEARGARVIGFDLNEELLAEARSRRLPKAEFRNADLRTFPELDFVADGLWSSFAAAYFLDLPAALASWTKNLQPGGWIALTEVDDFFAHEPMGDRTRALLSSYVEDALVAGRYDFRMGRKLRGALERAGLTVVRELELEDQELSFTGPALPEVLDAWRHRFERMTLLRDFCGESFGEVQGDFLHCLSRPDHRSVARVLGCIAMLPALAPSLEIHPDGW